MAATGKTQFNVYLPEALVVRVKHAAIDSRSSLSAFVERALEAALTESDRKDP